MNRWICLSLLVLTVPTRAMAIDENPARSQAAKDVATAFLADLKNGKFDAALNRCSSRMKGALAEHPLGEIWASFEKDVGPLQGLGAPTVTAQDAAQVVSFEATFAQAHRTLRVTVSPNEEVAGFFTQASQEALEAKGRALVEALKQEKFDAVAKTFGPKMSQAMNAGQLTAAWTSVQHQFGSFASISAVSTEPAGKDFTMVWIDCLFAKGPLRVKAAYDVKERLEGLFFVPGEKPKWVPPPYEKAEAFDDRPVVVQAGVDLPGFLSVPKGDGPFPAVVLVHGSGPADADETVGGVSVFKDLAHGLASKGVLVLRYTKRTKVPHSGPVKSVEDEVIEPVKAAVKLLQSNRQVDPKHLVVVGHSQGAHLAPRIAKEAPGVTGIVMLAAPGRPLEVLLEEQLGLITQDSPKDVRETLLAKTKAFEAQVRSPNLKPTDNVEFPNGGALPGSYYLDLRDYDPVKSVAELNLPTLIIQGGRDYQVSLERDFSVYQKALAGKKNVTLLPLPTLNHLMVAGTGPSKPEEYLQQAHVDVKVIDAIAGFVNPAAKKH